MQLGLREDIMIFFVSYQVIQVYYSDVAFEGIDDLLPLKLPPLFCNNLDLAGPLANLGEPRFHIVLNVGPRSLAILYNNRFVYLLSVV